MSRTKAGGADRSPASGPVGPDGGNTGALIESRRSQRGHVNARRLGRARDAGRARSPGQTARACNSRPGAHPSSDPYAGLGPLLEDLQIDAGQSSLRLQTERHSSAVAAIHGRDGALNQANRVRTPGTPRQSQGMLRSLK